jgi:hypothetical protein
MPTNVTDTNLLVEKLIQGFFCEVTQSYVTESNRAIILCGTPGSGKDKIMKEGILPLGFTEISFEHFGSFDYDYPVVVNGPGNDYSKTKEIKESLENNGYQTLMVFVNTSDEASRIRNTTRSRPLTEELRFNKWRNAQNLRERYENLFEQIIVLDNDVDLNNAPIHIKEEYETNMDTMKSCILKFARNDIDIQFEEMLAEKRIGIRKKMKQPNITGDSINDTLGKQTDYMNMNMPASDPVGVWSVKEETKRRFKERYGQLGEAKLRDTVAKIQRTYKESLTDPFTGSSAMVSSTTGNDDLSSSPLGNVDMAKEKEKLSIYGKKKKKAK